MRGIIRVLPHTFGKKMAATDTVAHQVTPDPFVDPENPTLASTPVSTESETISELSRPSPPVLSSESTGTETSRTQSCSHSGFPQSTTANSGEGNSGAAFRACEQPETLQSHPRMLSPGRHQHPGPRARKRAYSYQSKQPYLKRPSSMSSTPVRSGHTCRPILHRQHLFQGTKSSPGGHGSSNPAAPMRLGAAGTMTAHHHHSEPSYVDTNERRGHFPNQKRQRLSQESVPEPASDLPSTSSTHVRPGHTLETSQHHQYAQHELRFQLHQGSQSGHQHPSPRGSMSPGAAGMMTAHHRHSKPSCINTTDQRKGFLCRKRERLLQESVLEPASVSSSTPMRLGHTRDPLPHRQHEPIMSQVHQSSPGSPQNENSNHPPHPQARAVPSFSMAVPPHPPVDTEEPHIFHPPSTLPQLLQPQHGTIALRNHEDLQNIVPIPSPHLLKTRPHGLKTAVNKLPSYRFDPNNHQSRQTRCVVCMCDFEAQQLLRVLPCKHVFHAECVGKWFKTNSSCPLCRANGVPRDSHSD